MYRISVILLYNTAHPDRNYKPQNFRLHSNLLSIILRTTDSKVCGQKNCKYLRWQVVPIQREEFPWCIECSGSQRQRTLGFVGWYVPILQDEAWIGKWLPRIRGDVKVDPPKIPEKWKYFNIKFGITFSIVWVKLRFNSEIMTYFPAYSFFFVSRNHHVIISSCTGSIYVFLLFIIY